MTLAFLNSAGVHQMIGYIEPTWYGYMGWGCLDYFVEQPGRFTLAEAFYANNQALIHRLEGQSRGLVSPRPEASLGETRPRGPALSTQDIRGLTFDRDVVAFYGDPAWEARLAPGPCAWDQRLAIADGVYRLEIIPQRAEKTFQPLNTNGSQRGGRPIFQLLPHRVRDVVILEGADLHPLVTDNFVLVPLPESQASPGTYRVSFRAAAAN
jgi:zinc protease